MLFGLFLLVIGFILSGSADFKTASYLLMGIGGLMVLSKVLGLLKLILDFLAGLFGIEKKSADWIQRTHLTRADEYECSSCGEHFNKPYEECPSCGSRMKKVKYDPSWVDEMEMWDAIK